MNEVISVGIGQVYMWELKIKHEGLHAYRKVRGATKVEAETKARLQMDAWNSRWERLLETAAARQEHLQKKSWLDKQSDLDKRAKAHALALTQDAENSLAELRGLLRHALTQAHSIDWNSFKDTSTFNKAEIFSPGLEPIPAEPFPSDPEFKVHTPLVTTKFVDWILPWARKRKLRQARADEMRRKNDAEQRFAQAHSTWKRKANEIDQGNEAALTNYKRAQAALIFERRILDERQKAFNLGIDALKKSYFERVPDSLIRFWTEILSKSEYPDRFPRDNLLLFDPLTGVLAIDYELPPQKAIPNKKQVKYLPNRQEFQEVIISDAEFKRLYDDVLYQICLRTLHELFQADEIDSIKSIVFNGWVQAIDKATGANTHPCVMTVQVSKSEFLAPNLDQVDLKACFRSLKGISGSRLVDSTPVRPVLSLNKDDPRFVSAYDVAESLNGKTNLAAMDWLDFENLIRELFEKEFSQGGGEVRITQASRDGGVDAIAFDPNPIRGGKIVIQAKR